MYCIKDYIFCGSYENFIDLFVVFLQKCSQMEGPGDPKFDTFRVHFGTLPLGLLWGSEYIQNELKMEPKWSKIQPKLSKMEPKWTQNALKKRI